ncbi:MAG: NAD-dependent deacylase [Dermatophilaceae bacterium]
MTQVPDAILALARSAKRVTVLTGAGMSAESGVPTFRDPDVGLWEKYDPMVMATPQGWERDKPLVNAWFLSRVAIVQGVEPNAGHVALAEWGRRAGVEMRIVTQNIDDLHERAGAPVAAHLHGNIFAFRCDRCHRDGPVPPLPQTPFERLDPTPCEHCGRGHLRPGVVMFGEVLPSDAIQAAFEACSNSDLVVVVGTSGIVHPAAQLPYLAQSNGIPVIEIDPNRTAFSNDADHVWRATAAEGLPALVRALGG